MRQTLVRLAGGHGPKVLNMDPAYAKWYSMSSNRYKYFKWTPKTTRVTVQYVVVIPAILAYFAYQQDGKWNFRGKLRGDPIAEW